jgi:hypothetical protein
MPGFEHTLLMGVFKTGRKESVFPGQADNSFKSGFTIRKL